MSVSVEYLATWDQQGADRSAIVIDLTGGYANVFSIFPKVTSSWKGDRLDITYTLRFDDPKMSPFVLRRIYTILKTVNVIGIAVEGPVVSDLLATNGHRLATGDELVLEDRDVHLDI